MTVMAGLFCVPHMGRFGSSSASAVALQAFPAISSIKANNVDESEQGTIQVRLGTVSTQCGMVVSCSQVVGPSF